MSLSLKNAVQLLLDTTKPASDRIHVLQGLYQSGQGKVISQLLPRLLMDDNPTMRDAATLVEEQLRQIESRESKNIRVDSQTVSLSTTQTDNLKQFLFTSPPLENPREPHAIPDLQEEISDEQFTEAKAIPNITICSLLESAPLPFYPEDLFHRSLILYHTHIIFYTLLAALWAAPVFVGLLTRDLLLPLILKGGNAGNWVIALLHATAFSYTFLGTYSSVLLASFYRIAAIDGKSIKISDPFRVFLSPPRGTFALCFRNALSVTIWTFLGVMFGGFIVTLFVGTDAAGPALQDIVIITLTLAISMSFIRNIFAAPILVNEGLVAKEAIKTSRQFMRRRRGNFLKLVGIYGVFRIMIHLLLGSTLMLTNLLPIPPLVSLGILVISFASLEQTVMGAYVLLYLDQVRGDRLTGRPSEDLEEVVEQLLQTSPQLEETVA